MKGATKNIVCNGHKCRLLPKSSIQSHKLCPLLTNKCHTLSLWFGCFHSQESNEIFISWILYVPRGRKWFLIVLPASYGKCNKNAKIAINGDGRDVTAGFGRMFGAKDSSFIRDENAILFVIESQVCSFLKTVWCPTIMGSIYI